MEPQSLDAIITQLDELYKYLPSNADQGDKDKTKSTRENKKEEKNGNQLKKRNKSIKNGSKPNANGNRKK